jgi:dimethylhistidine N-methyltransferase
MNPTGTCAETPDPSQAQERQHFLTEVLDGLRQPAKELPCKYFYDATGSRLFEQICELEEYYLTRTELAILRQYVDEIADWIGPRCLLIEYGSGSSLKTELLLDRLVDVVAYIPIDLSREYLQRSAGSIADRYPGLEVKPLCADFRGDFQLPPTGRHEARRIVYFPGSTIGNFSPPEAAALLSSIAALCRPSGGFLLGFDLQKDVRTLEAAYNDSKGVTRDFNLNLLARINRELGADFQVDAFRHHAFYNRQLACIEMHLVSLQAQTVRLGGETFYLAKGESIRTERSYKYNVEEFRSWVHATGFSVERVWMDRHKLFAVLYMTVRDS